MKWIPLVAMLGILVTSFSRADNAPPPASSSSQTLYQSTTGAGSTDWSSYETDTAPGSISAAGMLGLSGGAITNVESIKDVSVALNSIASGGTKTGIALSFTPARSAIAPMDQSTYVGDRANAPLRTFLVRLLGSTTLGYAENDTSVSDATYHQQAASLQVSGFFVDNDDPVVGLYDALSSGKPPCDSTTIIAQTPNPPTLRPGSPPGIPTEAPEDVAADKAIHATNWANCKSYVAKQVPWNPSTYSFGYATGWIKPTTGSGPQDTLGHTYFVGGQWGFIRPKDPATSSNGMLIAVAYRKSENEPVLDTLGTAKVNYQNSSIIYAKLSGGSSTLRGLFEYNSTKSTNVTQSQLALKEAIGIDAQLAKNTWISFRFGKQNSIVGSTKQNASLFNISYSPAALLSN